MLVFLHQLRLHTCLFVRPVYFSVSSMGTVASDKDELVKTEVFDDDIFLIGINRPQKRNCVNHRTALALRAAFTDFNNRSDVTVAVLHGSGGNFCSGYDLSEVASGQLPQLDKVDDDFRPMGPSMMQFNKPVIAAIEGYAVAGGLELALMCDLRVAEESAVMGVFCRRFGVPLIDGGTIRLPQLIGLSRAMDMILTGREVLAKEALEIGLVNRVVATGTGLGQAIQLARNIKKFPQKCLNADRKSAYYASYDAKCMKKAFEYEFREGMKIVEVESVNGASEFADRQIGKHGSFNLNRPPGPKSKY